MKITASGLLLAALLLTVGALSQAQKGGGRGGLEDCREDNRNALKPVEAQYASASARLPKADQDRYKRMLAAIKTGGSTLSDCRAKTPKIAELKQTLASMITLASAPPPAKIGDKGRGGIVFHVTDGGKHGLVAEPADVPVMGGVMIFEAAVNSCNLSTTGGQSDWYLPSAGELGLLCQQRNGVGGFQTSGRDQYWTSTKLQQNPAEVWRGQAYFIWFSSCSSMWADTFNTGPNRSLLNARCIRKF